MVPVHLLFYFFTCLIGLIILGKTAGYLVTAVSRLGVFLLLSLIAGGTAVFHPNAIIRDELAHPDRILHIAVLILSPLILLLDSRLTRLDGVFLILLYIG